MIPEIALVRMSETAPDRPLLVLGPSLGTSADALWGPCAALLADRFEILAWELPGHGTGPVVTDPFTVGELAAGVLRALDDDPATCDHTFGYAGDSIGGAVGLVLALEHAARVTTATLACTGARIGQPDAWGERIAAVREHGMAYMVERSPAVWFGTGFAEREPVARARLVETLAAVDAHSYTLACAALAGFDVRDRLDAIRTPLTLIGGVEDTAAPLDGLRQIADAVVGARLIIVDGMAHLAPIEQPQLTAEVIATTATTMSATYEAGMAVRREVAGEAWVDRAQAATTEFTRDFQHFITTYAWGSVWTRPGLDRRSRSMITLTALIARGHHHELAMHVRAALTNGLTRAEIGEVLLQSAIYCGMPDANTAFRIAQSVFDELDHPSDD